MSLNESSSQRESSRTLLIGDCKRIYKVN